MNRVYKYRFYPNKQQAVLLENTLTICRHLYNAALQQHIYAHRLKKHVTYRKQQNDLPALRKTMPELATVHSQVLQDSLRRVDKAFRVFFERTKRKRRGEGVKAGFPRFKPKSRYNSFTYPQNNNGFKLLPNGHIWISKIGELRVFMHRKPVGKMKVLTVKRDRVGDWFVTLVTELPDVAPRKVTSAIGVDLGLKQVATLSSGEIVEPHSFLRKSENKIKRAQRVLSRRTKYSRNREKARVRLARLHRKVQCQRDDFLHKTSRWLVNRADLLVFEDLQVPNMMRNHRLAKSIGDASWGRLVQYASYKAESAGKRIELVDPRGTSQLCSGCGAVVRKPLSGRVHRCPTCGLLSGRDLNAAINILSRSRVRWGTAESTPVEIAPTPQAIVASAVKEAGSPQPLGVGGCHRTIA